jgi:hypothetical protein
MPVKRYDGTNWVSVAGDGAQGPAGPEGGSSTLTTKGDVLTRSSSALARLGVGSNDQVLTADSSTSTGLKWATPAAGKSFTLLNAGGTALSGSTTTVSGISGQDQLLVLVLSASTDSNSRPQIEIQLNSSATLHTTAEVAWEQGSAYNVANLTSNENNVIRIGKQAGTSNAAGLISGSVMVFGCNSSGIKTYTWSGSGAYDGSNNSQVGYVGSGIFNSASTISTVTIRTTNGNFDAGTVFVYGSA